MTEIMKINGNVLRRLEMGRESVHLKPTAISNPLQTLPDPKSHRKNPKNDISEKFKNPKIRESAGVGGNGRSPLNYPDMQDSATDGI